MATTKMTKQQHSKYIGTQLLSRELTDKITKEEFAAIAFYLAQRLVGEGNEKDEIVNEFNALVDNEIIYKNKIR